MNSVTTTKLYLGFTAMNGTDVIPIVINDIRSNINLLEIEDLADNIITSQCLVDENNQPAFLADYCYILHSDIELTEY